jgi:hypothetical protein
MIAWPGTNTTTFVTIFRAVPVVQLWAHYLVNTKRIRPKLALVSLAQIGEFLSLPLEMTR